MSHIGRGLHAQHRNAGRREMLKQIAIVGRNLDHQRACAQAETRVHLLAVAPGVGDPTRRCGGKIIIVGKNVLRRHRIIDLHQETGAADARHQRMAAFAGRFFRAKIAIGERGRAEIGEDTVERRSAETAIRDRMVARRHQRAM